MQAAVSFHNLRHRAERAEAQINAFLTHLAVKNACVMQHVGVAQLRQMLPLRSRECCTALQTVLGCWADRPNYCSATTSQPEIAL
jgi:hypothetical protein